MEGQERGWGGGGVKNIGKKQQRRGRRKGKRQKGRVTDKEEQGGETHVNLT